MLRYNRNRILDLREIQDSDLDLVNMQIKLLMTGIPRPLISYSSTTNSLNTGVDVNHEL